METDGPCGAKFMSVTTLRFDAPSLHFSGAEQGLHVDHTLFCNVAQDTLQHYFRSNANFRAPSTEIVWRKFWNIEYSRTMAVHLELWAFYSGIACQSSLVTQFCFDLSIQALRLW